MIGALLNCPEDSLGQCLGQFEDSLGTVFGKCRLNTECCGNCLEVSSTTGT